jgi:hypothetical protein
MEGSMNADEIRINDDEPGRRFAYVGDYTLREREDGTVDVTLDIHGDDVLVASGGTWDDHMDALLVMDAIRYEKAGV